MKNILQILSITVIFLSAVFLSPAAKCQTTILSEGFEANTIPAGWTQTFETGNTTWDFGVTGGFNGIPMTAQSGTHNARFYSTSASGTVLITPVINLGSCTSATLTFYHTQAYSGSEMDSLTLFYRTGPANSWVRLVGYQSSINSWTQEFMTLPEISASYQIAFRGFASSGNGVCLDEVTVMATRLSPFYEPWDSGNFTYNNWTVFGGNWLVDNGTGNPAPAADFSGQITVQNYNQWIETPVLSVPVWSCGDLWLDFDLKLVDKNNTGNEKLYVEIDTSGVWRTKTQFKNTGSFDWSSQHLKLRSKLTGSVKIRFRASGVNSDDFLHWYIDNVRIYSTCRPPLDLYYWGELYWTAPDCLPGSLINFIFDDGYWDSGWRNNPGNLGWFGNYFPVDAYLSGVLKEFQVYFVDNGSGSPFNMSIDIFNNAQTLIGSTQTFSASSPDIWIPVTVNDVPFTGPFYGMVKWDNLSGYSYYLATDENGPYVNQNLGFQYDGSSFSNLQSPSVFLMRATAMIDGELKTILLQPDGRPAVLPAMVNTKISSVGRSGDSGNHDTMGVVSVAADSSILIGYNVWRTDSTGTGPFYLRTPAPITQTHFFEALSPYPWCFYKCYIESVFEDPVNPGTVLCTSQSDTIIIHWIGINDINPANISIYPNPATDFIKVTASVRINSVEILNFIGQTIYTNNTINAAAVETDVHGLSPGIYFVKVTNLAGTKTTKITVTR